MKIKRKTDTTLAKTLNDLLENTLNRVLTFKLGLKVYEYLSNDKQVNWRDFEAELDASYPIKGTEVIFNKDLFEKWEGKHHNYKIINDEKLMSSVDITEELASEPFRHREMTLVYLFTILEDYGNSIVKIVNKPYYTKEIEERGTSWHSKINRYAKKRGDDLLEKFANPFNIPKSHVYLKFVDLLYDIKEKRNKIAHELYYPDIYQNFDADVNSIIILICYLFHINDPKKAEINYYPWYDYDSEI